MPTMPRKPDQTTAEGKARRGHLISARLNEPELEAAFMAFKTAQRVPPNDTDIVLLAVQEFLMREGYYKGRQKGGQK